MLKFIATADGATLAALIASRRLQCAALHRVSSTSFVLLTVTQPPGESSLRMVPSPWLSVTVASASPERLTKKVSLASKRLSRQTVTVIVLVAFAGRKVRLFDCVT